MKPIQQLDDPHLVTIATFSNSVEAQLAFTILQDAGIPAFVADDQLSGANWLLTNAIGGVKLRTPAAYADEAIQLLAEIKVDPTESSENDEQHRTAPPAKPIAQPNTRERSVNLAFNGAILCLLFWPLQLFVTYRLVKVFLSSEPLSAKYQRKLAVAVFINLAALALMVYLFGAILR